MANYESARATSRSLIYIIQEQKKQRHYHTGIRVEMRGSSTISCFRIFFFYYQNLLRWSFSIRSSVTLTSFFYWTHRNKMQFYSYCFPLLIPITRIQFFGYVEILVHEKLHRRNFNVKCSVKYLIQFFLSTLIYKNLVEISNIVR